MECCSSFALPVQQRTLYDAPLPEQTFALAMKTPCWKVQADRKDLELVLPSCLRYQRGQNRVRLIVEGRRT